jgi:hypothetical protein
MSQCLLNWALCTASNYQNQLFDNRRTASSRWSTTNNQPTQIAFAGKTIQLDHVWNRLTKTTLPGGIETAYQYNAIRSYLHLMAKATI